MPRWLGGMVAVHLQADGHDLRWFLHDLARDDVDRRWYGSLDEPTVVRAQLHDLEARRANCHPTWYDSHQPWFVADPRWFTVAPY